MKFINICNGEFINSIAFNSEVIDKYINQIVVTNKKIILIRGAKNSSKSILLHKLCNNIPGNQDMYVNIKVNLNFANGIYIGSEIKASANRDICKGLLNSIDGNPESSKFSDDVLDFRESSRYFINYLNNKAYIMKKHDYTNKFDVRYLSEKMRNELGLNMLNLAIDDFDCLSDEYQQAFSDNFKYFDKVVLTGDVEQSKMDNSDVEAVNINLFEDFDCIKDIINSHFEYVNSKNISSSLDRGEMYSGIFYPKIEHVFSDDTINMIISAASGNFDKLFNILYNFYEERFYNTSIETSDITLINRAMDRSTIKYRQKSLEMSNLGKLCI